MTISLLASVLLSDIRIGPSLGLIARMRIVQDWGLQVYAKDHVTHERLNATRLSFTCPITVPFRSLQ